FAVFLNGAWGIGKTFLIRKILKEHFTDKKDYVYVSLYGLTNIEEIDSALFQSMYPALGWKGTKIFGRLASAGLKFAKIDPDLQLSEVLNKFKAQIYVFDDL